MKLKTGGSTTYEGKSFNSTSLLSDLKNKNGSILLISDAYWKNQMDHIP